MLLQREEMKRARADDGSASTDNSADSDNVLAEVAAALAEANYVVALVGAGISRSCGIPDFRSREGIYSLVDGMDLGLPQAECLFDLAYFDDDPAPFYKFAHVLYPAPGERAFAPSKTHEFLRALEQLGKLGRVYSQNIDGLERAAGIKRVAQCHGSLAKVKCGGCKKSFDSAVIAADVASRTVATCPRAGCDGVLRPTVTFFGEKVTDKVAKMIERDAAKADLLLVMGTSMQVAPMSQLPRYMRPGVPQVLINNEPVRVKDHEFHAQLLGDCDDVCSRLYNAWMQSDQLKKPSEKRRRAVAFQPSDPEAETAPSLSSSTSSSSSANCATASCVPKEAAPVADACLASAPALPVGSSSSSSSSPSKPSTPT